MPAGRTAVGGIPKLAGLVTSVRKAAMLLTSCGPAKEIHTKCVGDGLPGLGGMFAVVEFLLMERHLSEYALSFKIKIAV